MNKNERQLIALEAWKNAKGKGAFIHPTGFGKTYESCVLINKVLEKAEGLVLILVPYTNLIKQWQETINNLVEKKHLIEVMTVQLYVMQKMYKSPLLLILDELDEFYSEERIKLVKGSSCNYKFILGLTATPYDKQGRHIVAFNYIPIVDSITEIEALNNNWISDYIQYNLPVFLNTKESEEYENLSVIIRKCHGMFNNFEQAMSVLSGNPENGDTGFIVALKHAMSMGWRKDLDLTIKENREINEMWNPNVIIGYAKTFIEAVRHRNNLVDMCEAKFEIILNIINKFYGTKSIIFSNSIAFATKINLLINKKFQEKSNLFDAEYSYSVLYHSELESKVIFDKIKNKNIKYGPKRLKEYYLDLVKKGYSKVISSAKALDKGLDIKDIRLAIIAGGNSANRQNQREGRAKRLEDLPRDEPVIIINLYCKNTKEEKDLKDRQKKSLKEKIVDIESINEIDMERKKIIRI